MDGPCKGITNDSQFITSLKHPLFSHLSTHVKLVMGALVWLGMVCFETLWYGAVRFDTAHKFKMSSHI